MIPTRKFQIAIVEDNEALGESLREVVDSGEFMECVGVWTSAEEALEMVEELRPQVILMDINLPGISGIEATARIKGRLPDIQIVMVTVYSDHEQIFPALKAGATGYLLKRSSPAEIREAIYNVLTGGAPMSAEIARRVVDLFRGPTPVKREEDKLTPREVEVLGLVAAGRTNREIADQIGLSIQTVRVHLKHVYEKLHVLSRVEAALKYRDTYGRPER